MPELPDVTIYVEALNERVTGCEVRDVRLRSPFLLRTVRPPVRSLVGKRVTGVRRQGKRIVLDVEGGLHLALHLMIAGRLHWKPPGAAIPGRIGLAAFDFDAGTLTLTEAGSKKRAALWIFDDPAALAALDRGGLEPLDATQAAFDEALLRENRTLKRALTDPRLFSGIGNAYSDEILHRARLSPVTLTTRLTPDERSRLRLATIAVLSDWTSRLRSDAAGRFPEKVTAFREGMAVHGRFGQPCPDCGTAVQRIVHADNETNYCARCQTGGKLLADRALSQLLRKDWPKTIDELER
jgi:formamidopyrimidine-DNA glycosylase